MMYFDFLSWRALSNLGPSRGIPLPLTIGFENRGVHVEVKRGWKRIHVDDLPSIVLVHGIFGFDKKRLGGLSYFAGAEKKDERVLVPDQGNFLKDVLITIGRYILSIRHYIGHKFSKILQQNSPQPFVGGIYVYNNSQEVKNLVAMKKMRCVMLPCFFP